MVLTTPLVVSVTTVAALAAGVIGAEALARRRFLSFLASMALLAGAIGVTAAFVLLFRQHWRIAISAVLGAAALALLIGNLRDLRLRGDGRATQRSDRELNRIR